MAPSKLSSLTIFFPFFNDEGTVDALLSQAYAVGRTLTEDLEVIAIHGGVSKDQTLDAILRAKKQHPDLVILDHSDNKEGYAVIKHGFYAATKEWVFYTDGDGQYHLKDLPKLVERQLATQSSIVNGYKISRSDPWNRVLLGKAYQLFCRLFFRFPIRDVDCDFRLIEKKLLSQIEFSCCDSSILTELILHLKHLGAKFSEVPVNHYPRSYGQSNYSWFSLMKEKIVGDLTLYFKWKQREPLFLTMAKIEGKFWWYVGLREAILHEVETIPIKDPLICDLGCGTGANMEALEAKGYTVHGVDISDTALAFCKQRGLKQAAKGTATALSLATHSVDVVLLIDLLCMLTKEEIAAAIWEASRILKPGGFLIVNEPAFQWLRSQHDIRTHMKKRFNKTELISLFRKQGFEVEYATHRVCFLFPLVAFVKLIKKLTFFFTSSSKSDLKIPPLNQMFLKIQRWENILMRRRSSLPFGSSIFLRLKLGVLPK
jgi:ubiquinone/menaquinone biosynthesis C-methylase UbiE